MAALITAPGPEAGIFLTNLQVGDWLSYETLSARRADLIMLRIIGNPDGTVAVDYTVNARMGWPYVTGPADLDEPVNNVLPGWDLTCGLTAAIGLLAAERHRSRTGEGQEVRLRPRGRRLSHHRLARLHRRCRDQRRRTAAHRQ